MTTHFKKLTSQFDRKRQASEVDNKLTQEEQGMKTIKGLMSVVAILFIIGMFANKPAHAVGGTISFAINGSVVKTGSTPLPIADTYTVGGETIKIDNYGGSAVIEYSEANDWLRMRNAEITSSTAPIDNVKFSFWRTFDTLRTQGTVTYSVSGSGVFVRSTSPTDPNNWISLRGEVEATVLGSGTPNFLSSPPPYPPNCALILTACATHQPASWTFNLTMPNTGFKVSHAFSSLPAGSDDLKAEFWVHLEKNTDRLDITASPGIRVKWGAPSGEGSGGEDDEPLCAEGTHCECVPNKDPRRDKEELRRGLPPLNPNP
jgi:hypothetical protein